MAWHVAPSYQSAKLVKVNEIERKGLVVETCPRCGGSGDYYIPPHYSGTCYKCAGVGKLSKWVKVYTDEEYNKYLATQQKTRERKVEKQKARMQELQDNSEANKKSVLEKFGFDVENPMVYLVAGGNTFEIKDLIKERGGRYNPALNWHFTKEVELPEGYQLVAIKFDDLYEWLPMVKRVELKEDAKKIADAAREEVTAANSKSEYIGEIKQRLRDLKVTLTSARAVSGAYGTSIMFTFNQGDNVLVWFTSCPPDDDKAVVGKTYLLTGTVKDHKMYDGIRQTYVNRCILKEFAI